MTVIVKLWRQRALLRSILTSIYFNFYYLPAKQAYKIPILLYKPIIRKMNGKISIEGNIKFGMIRLGFNRVSLYPNNGFMWENKGGTCIFKGICNIGNASSVSVGVDAILTFGGNFSATTSFKVACYKSIEFKEKVTFGWDNIVIDTDFHKLTKLNGGYTDAYGPITIGSYNYIGTKCLIIKGTTTPNYLTIGAGSFLNKEYTFPEYSVVAGNPITIKATDVYLNPDDDKVVY